MLAAASRPAGEDEVARALERLDGQPGLYFGCDRGIAGLHPLQAVLVDRPALALRVSPSGVCAQACSTLGQGLLNHPALQAWQTAARPGAGRRPLASLRELLARVAGPPNLRLVGALGFEAWRLAGAPDADTTPLGVLYLPEVLLERDSGGRWERVEFRLVDTPCASPPPVAPEQHATAVDGATGTTRPPEDDFAPRGHAAMVARALEHLRNPALVSLTLSQSFRRPFAGSAAAAFARLREVNPAPVSFFLNDGEGGRLFGASPDLQLVIEGREVASLPVCGTVARRPGAVGEAQSTRELLNESVDAASLAVCSDALRNDLAPLCLPGSLALTDRRRPMALATVVHTVDRLAGVLRDGVDAWDAVAATAAPAMLTGTPRAEAIAAIAALERSPRGWYGGLMVDVRADGSARVGTLLRAAWLRDGVAEVRTGGDLLADSDPAREEEESRIKAVSLWRALGLTRSDDAALAAPASAGAAASHSPSAGLRVELRAWGDPFEASVRDTLLACGVRLCEAVDGPRGGPQSARTTGTAAHESVPAFPPVPVVLVSPDPACATGLPDRPLLAWGDAACAVLRDAGATVSAGTPQQGRSATCHPEPGGPWPTPAAEVGLYGMWSLDDPAPAGWTIWARDDRGAPLALAHAGLRRVALLYRPDSLLCSPQTGAWLALALAWVAAPHAAAPALRDDAP